MKISNLVQDFSYILSNFLSERFWREFVFKDNNRKISPAKSNPENSKMWHHSCMIAFSVDVVDCCYYFNLKLQLLYAILVAATKTSTTTAAIVSLVYYKYNLLLF